jgi:hypothetical protein
MKIALFTVGFGRPELLYHQKRLLDKYLDEEFGLCLVDNTPGIMRNKMEKVCRENGIGYMHTPEGQTGHDDALNFAALHVTQTEADIFGFLDADIFPRKHTTISHRVTKSGFYGITNEHKPTASKYIWPGFFWITKEWLGGRDLNFSGIKDHDPRLNGDCGSMNHHLWREDDWHKMHLISFGYGTIREQLKDDENAQSWGYEIIDDWFHCMNSSHWLKVRDSDGRDRLLMEMIECL